MFIRFHKTFLFSNYYYALEITWSVWSEWSQWGECSATCNGGIQRRERICDKPDEELRVCVGNDVDIATCNNNTCVGMLIYHKIH